LNKKCKENKLFQYKKLFQIQNEFQESLEKEFSSIRNEFSTKQIAVFEKYRKSRSLAGMETFLVYRNESLYFEEMYEYIQSHSKEFKSNPKDLQTMISENLKSDFGEEDFRYLQFEREKSDWKKLIKLLKKMIYQTKSNLQKVNPDYIKTPNDLKNYYKAKGNPKELGSNVELAKAITPQKKIEQLKNAEENLKLIWRDGFDFYQLLTYKIIPVQSKGLVSYSHFTELGISYINILDRNILETIDDLLHENSHHHLNLILKKFKILKNKNPEMKYYSPWRDSLRSLYAILHAVFTFSFGARLFLHFYHCMEPLVGVKKDFHEQVAFRFVEETLMLQYSLEDLELNQSEFTAKGVELLKELKSWNQENLANISNIQKKIQKNDLKVKISGLKKKLDFAKSEYQVHIKHGNKHRKQNQ
jgi:hypothetical protein